MVDISLAGESDDAMRQRLLIEQIPGVAWTTDRELRFTKSQGRALSQLGIKPDQVVGMTIEEYLRGTEQAVVGIEAHRRALFGEASTLEMAVMGRVFQIQVEPLIENGQITGTIGVALDITERKAAEQLLRASHGELEACVRERTVQLSNVVEALRQSEQRYASILDAPSTFIARSDLNRRLTYMNEAYARAFGTKLGDDFLIIIHPDDCPRVGDIPTLIRTASGHRASESRCRVNGQWRWVFWQTSAIRDAGGNDVELQAVGLDVHERHRTEESLKQSENHYKELAESNRLLLMELDHRVRNNLAGLLGLISLMRDVSRDVPAFADAIDARLRAMAHVHHLLTEHQWRPVDLQAVVASLLEATNTLACETVTVTLDGPAVQIAPQHTLALSMILLEWLTNSCKYGAHTLPTGRLGISWQIKDINGIEALRLQWKETGGPPIHQTITGSLGTQLVQSFATRELKGKVELRYPQEGADHVLEFPYQRGATWKSDMTWNHQRQFSSL